MRLKEEALTIANGGLFLTSVTHYWCCAFYCTLCIGGLSKGSWKTRKKVRLLR